MRRGALLTAGVVLAVVLGVALGAMWLPGPRAPIPAGPAPASPVGSGLFRTDRSPGLPDPRLTPGSVNPAARQDALAETVCKTGWATSVRPPAAYTSALKLAQIVEYGYTDRDPRHYQEDHLVPLELGGAPRDPRNLWPEPLVLTLPDGTSVRADQKDKLEDSLNRQVCAGHVLLADAQQLIAGNWIAAWRSLTAP